MLATIKPNQTALGYAVSGGAGVTQPEALAGMGEESPLREGWCIWGKFVPVKLLEATQGLYHVRFGGGETRWATGPELTLPSAEPSPARVADGDTVLVPMRTGAHIDADGAADGSTVSVVLQEDGKKKSLPISAVACARQACSVS